jgi:Tfp pilus assembly protein FimT
MITIPQFQSLIISSKLDGAARELDSALQYAANLSVRYQRSFGVATSTAQNRLCVFDPNPSGDPPSYADETFEPKRNLVENPFHKGLYEVTLDAPGSYQGVVLVSAPAEVIFHPDGHTGVNDSELILALGERRKTITVSGTTGRIAVQ